MGRATLPSVNSELRNLHRTVGRTITRADRRLLSGFVVNRRFAPRRVVLNMDRNIGSNAVYPMFYNSTRGAFTVSRLLGDLA